MQDIRMGLIGIGVMGSRHASSIFAGDIDGMVLTAVCDIKPGRLAWAEAQFGDKVARFERAEDLIDSGLVDAVLVAVPHYLHTDYSIYAFERGLHVICEKPAGVYAAQVEEMNAAAKKSGKVFSLMYNQRTNPYYLKLREMVSSGELGELRRFTWIITNWYRSQSYYDSSDWRATWDGEGGGVLINQCPHNIDMWQLVCGLPVRVRAFCQYGRYHTIDVEDSATIYAEYKNGMTAQFITTTGEPCGTNRIELTADKGKVIIEETAENEFRFRYWKFSPSEREFNATFTGGFGEPAAEMFEYVPDEVVPYWDGHKKIIRNFVAAIRHSEPLIAPGEEGLNAVQLINAINTSAWTDNWAELPVDKDRYLSMLNEKRTNASRTKVAREIDMDVTASKS